MAKSRAGIVGWHAGGTTGRNVTMIKVGVPREATLRSKIILWAVGNLVRVATGVIAAGFTTPVRAVGIGILTGLLVGFLSAVVLFCWPAIRHPCRLALGRRDLALSPCSSWRIGCSSRSCHGDSP
jgi:hypothetical protein